MFSSRRLGLFDTVPCPETSSCNRNPCPFSHHPGLQESLPVHIPTTVNVTNLPLSTTGPGSSQGPPKSILKSKPTIVSVPAKRPMPSPSPISSESAVTRPSTQPSTSTSEPPRKLQRLDGTKRGLPLPATPSTSVCLSSLCPPSPFLSDPPNHEILVNACHTLLPFHNIRLASRFSTSPRPSAKCLSQSGRQVSRLFSTPSCTSLHDLLCPVRSPSL